MRTPVMFAVIALVVPRFATLSYAASPPGGLPLTEENLIGTWEVTQTVTGGSQTRQIIRIYKVSENKVYGTIVSSCFNCSGFVAGEVRKDEGWIEGNRLFDEDKNTLGLWEYALVGDGHIVGHGQWKTQRGFLTSTLDWRRISKDPNAPVS